MQVMVLSLKLLRLWCYHFIMDNDNTIYSFPALCILFCLTLLRLGSQKLSILDLSLALTDEDLSRMALLLWEQPWLTLLELLLPRLPALWRQELPLYVQHSVPRDQFGTWHMIETQVSSDDSYFVTLSLEEGRGQEVNPLLVNTIINRHRDEIKTICWSRSINTNWVFWQVPKLTKEKRMVQPPHSNVCQWFSG